jgi:hypothetical protein
MKRKKEELEEIPSDKEDTSREVPNSPAFTPTTTRNPNKTSLVWDNSFQNEHSISFTKDISTMDHTMLQDMQEPLPSETQVPERKSKKKSKNIFGFFKKIFTKKMKKKKKKGKKQQVHVDESFMSSTTDNGNHYQKTKVDFTKPEIFSNE